MAEISWIKIKTDIFDDEKIKIIQSMPEGDSILIIWIWLIALAGKCNSNGLVLIDDEFPYSDEMLSVIFRKPLSTIRLALNTFERFRMLEVTQKGIYITNFEKHQNAVGMDKIREQNRIRKQRQRDIKREISQLSSEIPDNEEGGSEDITCTECDVSHSVTDVSRDMSRDVTQQRENKNIEKEKEILISPDEDIVSAMPEEKAERLNYQRIMDDYNKTCDDLPEISAVSDARKRSIRAALNELKKLKLFPELTPYEKLHQLFCTAQESEFLSGRSGKWDGCSFDWLINKKNALKVLEGNYSNNKSRGGAGNVRDSTGTGNNGSSGGTGDRALEGTTAEALERFKRNQKR